MGCSLYWKAPLLLGFLCLRLGDSGSQKIQKLWRCEVLWTLGSFGSEEPLLPLSVLQPGEAGTGPGTSEKQFTFESSRASQ